MPTTKVQDPAATGEQGRSAGRAATATGAAMTPAGDAGTVGRAGTAGDVRAAGPGGEAGPLGPGGAGGPGGPGEAGAAGEAERGGGASGSVAESRGVQSEDGDPPPVPPEQMAQSAQPGSLDARVIEALRSCFDPEIPVNIFELGLIYGLGIDVDRVRIRMTLTSPMCPVAGSLPGEVAAKVRAIPGVAEATVDLVWDPPWDPNRMTEAAKLELGMF